MESGAYLTNRRTGDFLSDSSLYNILGGSQQVVKRFLVTDEESIRLKKTRTAAKKLNDILPSNDEFESIPLRTLG